MIQEAPRKRAILSLPVPSKRRQTSVICAKRSDRQTLLTRTDPIVSEAAHAERGEDNDKKHVLKFVQCKGHVVP